tara:strand:+ start:496 stop:1185 length:690 start_codon:yes stop_codon:yes gene_type:complete
VTKKILLVSGCSFTTHDFVSVYHPEKDCSYEKWPKILAEKLNMDCINLGRSGAGNEYISNTLIDQIEAMDKSKIGLVIPAWSQCRRRDYQTYFERSKSTIWRHEMYDLHGDTRYWIRKSLKTQYFFQIYCDYYNIPYKQVQMIELFKDNLKIKTTVEKEHYNVFAKSEVYFNKLKNFIGETSSILSLQDVLTDNRARGEKYEEFSLSSQDRHPSEKGHHLIAEYIYENI